MISLKKKFSPFLPVILFSFFPFLPVLSGEWHRGERGKRKKKEEKEKRRERKKKERSKKSVVSLPRPVIIAVPMKNQSNEHQVLVCHSGYSAFLLLHYEFLCLLSPLFILSLHSLYLLFHGSEIFFFLRQPENCSLSLICLVVSEKTMGSSWIFTLLSFFSLPFHFSCCRSFVGTWSSNRETTWWEWRETRMEREWKQETNGFFGASQPLRFPIPSTHSHLSLEMTILVFFPLEMMPKGKELGKGRERKN